MPPTTQRRDRARDLVRATRALFDERGMQDAPIEDIARAVGIARGLIYREFASKDELFVLTVTDYLDELDQVLTDALRVGGVGEAGDDELQLEAWARAYAGFCLRYPAFLDCSMSLMRRPASELRELVSESVWLQLGQGMARCIDHVSRLLADIGVRDDPDYLANVLWTSALGVLHLTRSGVGVRQDAPGIPGLFVVDPDRIVDTLVAHARAIVR